MSCTSLHVIDATQHEPNLHSPPQHSNTVGRSPKRGMRRGVTRCSGHVKTRTGSLQATCLDHRQPLTSRLAAKPPRPATKEWAAGHSRPLGPTLSRSRNQSPAEAKFTRKIAGPDCMLLEQKMLSSHRPPAREQILEMRLRGKVSYL